MSREKDRRDTVDAQADDFLTIWKARERTLMLALRTGSPATVVAYDPATQTCSLTVDALMVQSTPAPVDVPDPPIALQRVPVAFLRAMGGLAYDTVPVLPGDTGMVLCMDRAIDEWRRLGVPCDPVDGRTHSLADAVFLPGFHADTDPIVPPTSLAARVIEAPLIHLGVNATQFMFLGTAIVAALTGVNATLAAVPNATDPVTVITLANANKAAILAIIAAFSAGLSTRVAVSS